MAPVGDTDSRGRAWRLILRTVGSAHSSLTVRLRRASGVRAGGFTVMELIGVMAIVAMVAAAIFPSVIRRIDQAAGTRETSDLNVIADAYTQYSLRKKNVPGVSTWASNLANHMSLPVASITATPRGYARACLVDMNLSIDGGGLSYTQTTNGTTKPVSAPVLLISSQAKALPVSSGIPSSAEFNAIWDAPEGIKPSGSTWASWTGKGDDLRIKKLNLEPLFYQLILVNHDKAAVGRFSIDGSAAFPVPTTNGWSSYYMDGTAVGLHDASGALQTRYVL